MRPISDDGPGHYNPDPSEGLWGGGVTTSKAVRDRVYGPTLCGTTVVTPMGTRSGCKLIGEQRMPGAGLSCRPSQEGAARKASLPAVLGKTRRTE